MLALPDLEVMGHKGQVFERILNKKKKKKCYISPQGVEKVMIMSCFKSKMFKITLSLDLNKYPILVTSSKIPPTTT